MLYKSINILTAKMSDNNVKKLKTSVIGIDLGTTNSCVSIISDSKPIILKNEEGQKTTPSIVSFFENKILVGEQAKNKLMTHPSNTIFASKRLIGRKFADPEIQKYVKTLPYDTLSHCNGDIWIKVDDKKYSPTQIGAFILTKLKNIASKFSKEEVKKSVITVPAYFNDSQRQATKDAGRIAGLDVVRVINEPTAAALAYGLDKSANGVIAVYDLGGGTFDISILELDDGIFHVKATNGNTFLGGEDLDNKLVEHITSKLSEGNGKAVLSNSSMQKIKDAAEKARIELSTLDKTTIRIPDLSTIDNKQISLLHKLTRNELEEIVKKIVLETVEPCKRAIRDAGIDKSDIKHVILVGGMTRMPLVRKVVKDIFGTEPNTDVNPDEAVAKGAALQAGVLTGSVKDVLLLDVVPLSLGIELQGGLFNKIIKRNTTIPFKETQLFSTSEDNQTEVDIRVYQGERALTADNKYLGAIKLKNILPAPRGVPKIAVSFESDANGILKVTACDNITKEEQSMEIIPSSGLTEVEIQSMIDEYEEKKILDEKRLRNVEFLLEVEKFLSENNSDKKKLICQLKKFCSNPDFDLNRAKALFDEIKS